MASTKNRYALPLEHTAHSHPFAPPREIEGQNSADGVVRTLLQARALIDATVAAHRRAAGRVPAQASRAAAAGRAAVTSPPRAAGAGVSARPDPYADPGPDPYPGRGRSASGAGAAPGRRAVRGHGPAPGPGTITDYGAHDDALARARVRLIASAGLRVTAVLSGDERQAQLVAEGIQMLAARQAHEDRIGGPVVIRLLASPKALDTPLVRTVAPRVPHCQVRVVDNDLEQTLMIDGRTLLVRGERADGGGPVSTQIEDPGACRAVELLLIGAWRAGSPLAEYRSRGSRPDAAIRERVLESLYAGRPDAVAADRMDISLRTYRRHVAEIMRELGAESRFQAGVRAVELRLLTPA